MAMLATPKTLGDVWELPVGAFNPGMRQFEQAQQFDNQTLSDMMSAEQYKQQERPLTLASLAGQNRNRDAELPGIQARGKLAGIQADEALGQYDQKMESWAAENAGKVQKAHYETAMRAGPLLQQFAEMAAYNPQSIPRIREMMTKQGLGDFWNPDWDNSDPATITAGMHDFGNALTNATPTMRKLMDSLQSKETIASEKNATTERVARLRGEISKALTAARGSKGKASPDRIKKLEELQVQAIQAGDMEAAALLSDTIRYNRNPISTKPEVDTAQVPILKPPTPAVNPLASKNKPDPLGIR